MAFETKKNDEEWRGELSRDRYAVLRKAATDAPSAVLCSTSTPTASSVAAVATRYSS